MFEFLTARAERRSRDRRAARMMLRDHGSEASDMLDRRVASTIGRDRSHWKRVRRALDDLLDEQDRAAG